MKGRMAWNTAEFAAIHKLGNPVFGNFFQAEWDLHCDEMRKKVMTFENICYFIKFFICGK